MCHDISLLRLWDREIQRNKLPDRDVRIALMQGRRYSPLTIDGDRLGDVALANRCQLLFEALIAGGNATSRGFLNL